MLLHSSSSAQPLGSKAQRPPTPTTFAASSCGNISSKPDHSSPGSSVQVHVRAALEAAHEAIQSFFLLCQIFGTEAKIWWVFNHRAFLEALCMANLMRDFPDGDPAAEQMVQTTKDPMFNRARSDIGMPRPYNRCLAIFCALGFSHEIEAS